MKTESAPIPAPVFDGSLALPMPFLREPTTARTVAFAQRITEGDQAGMYALFGVQRTYIITLSATEAATYLPASEPVAEPAPEPAS